MDINELIIGAQSADKHTREVAETQLLQWCDSDASQVFKALTNVALQHEASFSRIETVCFIVVKKIDYHVLESRI